MKRLNFKILFVVLATMFMAGCDLNDQKEEEESSIQSYLKAHNYTSIVPKESGLYYIETKTGTGDAAVWGKNVKVEYTLNLTDGTKVEDGTLNFILGYYGIIEGLNEGVSYMKVGGKAILLIPSDIAYGTSGYGDIPGYTPLVFTVELLDAN
jgi:FKBP-type peptidyl-prolyl cis-trans isomerase